MNYWKDYYRKKVNSSVKLIHLTHPHEQNKLELPPTVMALGFFDGIHLGHQCVIRTAKKIADERGYKKCSYDISSSSICCFREKGCACGVYYTNA